MKYSTKHKQLIKDVKRVLTESLSVNKADRFAYYAALGRNYSSKFINELKRNYPNNAVASFYVGCHYVSQLNEIQNFDFKKRCDKAYKHLLVAYNEGVDMSALPLQIIACAYKICDSKKGGQIFNLIQQRANDNDTPYSKVAMGDFYLGGHLCKKDNKIAYGYYLSVGEQNAEACHRLGVCNEYGFGVNKNKEYAIQLYKAAHDQGCLYGSVDYGYALINDKNDYKASDIPLFFADLLNLPYAKFKMGKLLISGQFSKIEKDEALAVVNFLKAFPCVPQGMLEAGVCILQEAITTKDLYIATHHYLALSAIKYGFERAFYYLDEIESIGQDFRDDYLFDEYLKASGDIIARNKKLAESGDGMGWLVLGNCYRTGYKVERDLTKAEECYVKGAFECDNDRAFAILCEMCMEDNNIKKLDRILDEKKDSHRYYFYNKVVGMRYYQSDDPKDQERAIKFLTIAADGGDVDAICALGVSYVNGIGVDVDAYKGVNLIEKAFDGGVKHASYILGECYRDGVGATKDAKKAFNYFVIAAREGIDDALVNLYFMYKDGEGCEKSLKRAQKCLISASEEYNPEANCILAECYESGIDGFEQDYSKAFIHCSIAAEGGDEDAQYMLSRYYHDGIGTEVNYQKASEWMRRALGKPFNPKIKKLF